jgi:hypothetical protein
VPRVAGASASLYFHSATGGVADFDLVWTEPPSPPEPQLRSTVGGGGLRRSRAGARAAWLRPRQRVSIELK